MTTQHDETSDDDLDLTSPDTRAAGRWHAVGVPTQKSRNFGTALRRLVRLLGHDWELLVLVVVLALLSTICMVAGPRVLGRGTDVIIRGIIRPGGIDLAELHRVLLTAAAIYGIGAVLAIASSHVLVGVVQRLVVRLRAAVEDKIHALPLAYVDRLPRGDLLSRVTNDIDNLAQSLQQTLGQMVNSVFLLAGTAGMMVAISPLLALVAMTVVPATVWSMRFIGSRSRPRFLDQWRYTGDLNAQVEETFTGHAVVKAFGRQQDAEARFRETNDALYEASLGAQFLSTLLQPLTMFLGNAQYVLVAVVGGVRVASGALSVGDIQAFIQYSRSFTFPLTQLASVMNVFQSGIASLERVLDVVDAPEEAPDPPPSASPTPARGRVVFEDVRFSYDPDRPLIEDLTFTVEPGQTVAIVGPTGAGKTTLVNLLMRFYELDGGRILLDGRDIVTMPRRELRSQIGMVLQDTWLFQGTIRDNLAYGNPEAPEEALLGAARATYVNRFVHSLPNGYDTVLGDEGDNVSAGEKQLLTIARAFVADRAILILDEATSSVDTRTEVLVQEAMNRLRANRTSFVIAHRLSTIRGADVILVLEAGRIVQQGTHADLVAREGPYRRLYESQFAAAATDVD